MTNESTTDVWNKVFSANIRRQANTIRTTLNGKLRGFNQDTGTAYADTISHVINSDGSITYKLRVVDTLGAARMEAVFDRDEALLDWLFVPPNAGYPNAPSSRILQHNIDVAKQKETRKLKYAEKVPSA